MPLWVFYYAKNNYTVPVLHALLFFFLEALTLRWWPFWPIGEHLLYPLMKRRLETIAVTFLSVNLLIYLMFLSRIHGSRRVAKLVKRVKEQESSPNNLYHCLSKKLVMIAYTTFLIVCQA